MTKHILFLFSVTEFMHLYDLLRFMTVESLKCYTVVPSSLFKQVRNEILNSIHK